MQKKIVISLQREKCIGCNFCAEVAGLYFAMSKKDGKSNLVKSVKKKNFYTLKISANNYIADLKKACTGCPVKIIKINNKIL